MMHNSKTHTDTQKLIFMFILQIGRENPALLVAHAYTRYLGDLSGGQVLGKITQKSLGLSSKEGLSFFSFPGVTSPNRFKQLYRSRMDSIELTEAQRAEVLEEAVSAFELNIQVRTDVVQSGVSDQQCRKTGTECVEHSERKQNPNKLFFSHRFLMTCKKC